MTTEQKFNCIFCKDVFENKEELQVHFRKHADPHFKKKDRFGNDPQMSDEKSKEKSDMVSCDVCSQMFPTISKAITHKHKVHPDHDVKYFCPWCGKLFTMKHHYNIHIQSSHEKQDQIENKYFHCDCCDVDFFLPAAMLYHNKFFHRQDTDIPDVGFSKKLRLYNQEALQLYYCAFCGEEYENKVNLFKHLNDDHGDENQSPEEVLRCPLCEAIFYHLDAYEIHLSFHTVNDLYCGTSELIAGIDDFSLETVPPVIEKVESREDFEAEAPSQDTDIESNVNSMGIEKFLELAMDQPEDSNSGKVKKKKHKKSKKSAITLDEFLSMNQDVFGEDLDFQGVEELPTRVVKKRVKNNKKAANAMASAELEKLKQKGIVVVKVGAAKPKVLQKKLPKVTTPNREITTSSEVLTKLINQSNNQIKIVKKTVPTLTINETVPNVQIKPTDENKSNLNEIEAKTINKCGDKSDVENINETKDIDPKPNTTVDNSMDIPSPKPSDNLPSNISSMSTTAEIAVNESADLFIKEHDTNNITDEQSDHDENNINSNVSGDVTLSVLKKNGLESVKTNDKLLPKDQPNEESDSEMLDKNTATDTKSDEDSDEHMNELEDTNSKNNKVEPTLKDPVSSLSTLKYLSHLTIKPVNQINTASEKTTAVSDTKSIDKPGIQTERPETVPMLNIEKEKIAANTKAVTEKVPNLDPLNIINKNITIKSVPVSTHKDVESGSEAEEESEEAIVRFPNSIKLKNVSENTNITIKKIKTDNQDSSVPKATNPTKSTYTTKPTNKVVNSVSGIPNIKIEIAGTESPSKANILKHLPNITTKPVPARKILQSPVKQTSTNMDKEQEIIEISDIDDSDSETDHTINTDSKIQQNTSTSIDPLKNISKHITVKSLNQPKPSPVKQINVEKQEDPNNDDNQENNVYKCDANKPSDAKVSNKNMSSKNIALQNALKHLGKNITVKSGNSSPCQSAKSQDPFTHDFSMDINEPDDDLDSDNGQVKITELESDNVSNNEDSDFENSENQPIIESPHDSDDDNEKHSDNVDEDLVDFESEITASAVAKTNEEVVTNKNTECLNSLKNISKNLTIKSLNIKSTEKQDNNQSSTKQSFPQESAESSNPPSFKQTIIRPGKQLPKEYSNDCTSASRNVRNVSNTVENAANENLNQKVSVNKEVTVKTFQTKTVIQEITTTVTKTIKTVNQSMKQETRNSSQMNTPMIPQKVHGMRPSMSKNLQGVVIRQATPTVVRPNNVAQVRSTTNIVRPSKQIVAVRPGLNMRPTTPRTPNPKTNLPKSSPNKQVIGKPLKFSPSAMVSATVKRTNSEDLSGPFSCFKKPKESLIPVSDIPSFAGGGDATVQVKAASQTSYMSTSRVVKGNSVVTATQMKSEVSSMQQTSRVNSATGSKVKSAQVQSTVVQECETTSKKRTTLEAIERLQKQGLLVKKPRVEVNENSDFDEPDDNVEAEYSSADENND